MDSGKVPGLDDLSNKILECTNSIINSVIDQLHIITDKTGPNATRVGSGDVESARMVKRIPPPPVVAPPVRHGWSMVMDRVERAKAWVTNHKVKTAALVAIGLTAGALVYPIVHSIVDQRRRRRRIATIRKDKDVVVVVGAESLAGQAMVARLESLGYVVYALVSRDEDLTLFGGDHRPNVKALAVDMTNPDSVFHAANEVHHFVEPTSTDSLTPLSPATTDRLSGVSTPIASPMNSITDLNGCLRLVAVINAASSEFYGPLEIANWQEYKNAYEVNVLGAALIAKAFLPLLRHSAGTGRFINVSSVSPAIARMPFVTAMSASKQGLDAFINSLRDEVSPIGVSVICLSPMPPSSRKAKEKVQQYILMNQLSPNFASLPAPLQTTYGSSPPRTRRASMPKQHINSRDKYGLSTTVTLADAVVEAITAPQPPNTIEYGDRIWLYPLVASLIPANLLSGIVKAGVEGIPTFHDPHGPWSIFFFGNRHRQPNAHSRSFLGRSAQATSSHVTEETLGEKLRRIEVDSDFEFERVESGSSAYVYKA